MNIPFLLVSVSLGVFLPSSVTNLPLLPVFIFFGRCKVEGDTARLLQTPSAAARVWAGSDDDRRMPLNASSASVNSGPIVQDDSDGHCRQIPWRASAPSAP